MISYICPNRDANVLFLGCFMFVFFTKLMISEILFYNLLVAHNTANKHVIMLQFCFVGLFYGLVFGLYVSLCTWRKFSFSSILRCVY
jgi:hypothetical protein